MMPVSRAVAMLCPVLVVVVACGGAPPVVGGPFPGNAASATYRLGAAQVTLKDGTFVEKTGAGPDDIIATDLTGTKLDADLDGDGDTDEAVVLTRDDGPLKMHYLAVLSNAGDAVDVTAIPLGLNVLVEELRLAPKGGVYVKLLKHEEGTPMDSPPTLRTTEQYRLQGGQLEKVGGEAGKTR
ncbi:MAG TPA: hypothetical protein VL400_27910 [Polyangiaceae bacterium]|jgi:hypothetical protein|nr:hypothetical protein [Polyangiaceae bacterium]